MSNLGFITPQITMSLGDGSINLGYITPGITTMLGAEPGLMPSLVGLGQDPMPGEGSAGQFIFGAMLFGLGVSLGFALGVSHGVKVAR